MNLKKTFGFLLSLGAMVVLFAACSRDIEPGEPGEPERPTDNSVYALSVDQDYIFGVSMSVSGTIDSLIVNWEPAGSSLVSISEDSQFVTSEMVIGQDGELVEIFNINTIANVKTINSGSETLEVSVSYLQNGEWWTLRAVPRSLTIQKYDFNATHDAGVTIGGITWATRNVGTSGSFVANPGDPGLYYRWNSKVDWNGLFPPLNAIVPWSASRDSASYLTAWDKINDPCPEGWRMPVQEELQKLFSAGKKWESNGLWIFEDENLLFLPAAGYRYERDGILYLDDINGTYWSSSTIDTYTAYALSIADTEDSKPHNSRNDVGIEYGLSCRCVKAEE